MIVHSQEKGGRSRLPSIPYAIPLNRRNTGVTQEIRSPAIPKLRRDWPLVVVLSGTLFLTLATAIGLTWAIRRGGSVEDATDSMNVLESSGATGSASVFGLAGPAMCRTGTGRARGTLGPEQRGGTPALPPVQKRNRDSRDGRVGEPRRRGQDRDAVPR